MPTTSSRPEGPEGGRTFSKEPPNETRMGSARGVLSLALTFGTLLSSQGTDASFGAVSGALRASLRVSDSIRRFRVRFPVSGSTADPALCCFSVSAFRLSRCTRLYQKVSVGFPGQFESALETHVSAALVEAVVPRYWTPSPRANRLRGSFGPRIGCGEDATLSGRDRSPDGRIRSGGILTSHDLGCSSGIAVR